MNGSYRVDANIFIASWNLIYPIRIFPSLWEKISQHRQDLILIKPVYDEIDPILSTNKNLPKNDKEAKYPLHMWLVKNKFVAIPIEDDVEKISLDLEKKYEIKEKTKGADQTDITLIAYAKINVKTVVTFEELQDQRPKHLFNYKIPLICKEENIECIDFTGLLQNLGIQI